MKAIDDAALKQMLTYDYLGRNQQLIAYVQFVNSFDQPTVLAIDGPWGSGKTIFVRQLELLNRDEQTEIGNANAASDTILRQFRDKYLVYYFNAWENDFLDDPLQALLFKLIADISTEELQEASLKKALVKFDAAALVKNLSKGGIDLSALTDEESMVKEIKSVIDKKQHVHEILDKYTDRLGKKLLFVIDELDRCKPSFAVNLLEVIKHYFSEKEVVFVVATNNTQLAHTVCKYYGANFDGASYLNRFFDFSCSLHTPDREKYIKQYLNRKNTGRYSQIIPVSIAAYLGMSLRETESYLRAVDLIIGYMDNTHGDDTVIEMFCRYVFAPFALALKIERPTDYSSFIHGGGNDLVRFLCSESKEVNDFTKRYSPDNAGSSHANTAYLAEVYDELFSRDFEVKAIHAEFERAISLISDYTTV